MTYEIGDVISFLNMSGKKYFGKITEFNNGYYTVESFNGYTSIVDPKKIIKKLENHDGN